MSFTLCHPYFSLYCGNQNSIFESFVLSFLKGLQSQRAILVLATGIPWFWNLSLSCLWSGCSDREIELGHCGSGMVLQCICGVLLFNRVLWSEPCRGTVHTQGLFLLLSPLFFWQNAFILCDNFTDDNGSKIKVSWLKSMDYWQATSKICCSSVKTWEWQGKVWVHNMLLNDVCKGQTVIFPN